MQRQRKNEEDKGSTTTILDTEDSCHDDRDVDYNKNIPRPNNNVPNGNDIQCLTS